MENAQVTFCLSLNFGTTTRAPPQDLTLWVFLLYSAQGEDTSVGRLWGNDTSKMSNACKLILDRVGRTRWSTWRPVVWSCVKLQWLVILTHVGDIRGLRKEPWWLLAKIKPGGLVAYAWIAIAISYPVKTTRQLFLLHLAPCLQLTVGLNACIIIKSWSCVLINSWTPSIQTCWDYLLIYAPCHTKYSPSGSCSDDQSYISFKTEVCFMRLCS